jgi:hypothetical protein
MKDEEFVAIQRILARWPMGAVVSLAELVDEREMLSEGMRGFLAHYLFYRSQTSVVSHEACQLPNHFLR